MRTDKNATGTPQNRSIASQMSDPLQKIGEARSLIETVRMAHHCDRDDIDLEALEEVTRRASNQLQDALQEIQHILEKEAVEEKK